jgi:putative DNA primase/helicase
MSAGRSQRVRDAYEGGLTPRDISCRLARRVDALVLDLLPGGHREGHEWRCGSILGEAGGSLGVHLIGDKAGVWSDFSTGQEGQKGDALDLVRAVLGLEMAEALIWARRWLGLDEGEPRGESRDKERSARLAPAPRPHPVIYPEYCRKAWAAATPIGDTLGECYLDSRGLCFTDHEGVVLRFAERHARRTPAGDLEHHPALLALLSDIQTGKPSGLINIYLKSDGGDRLRDPKGKTCWGRAAGSAVMLSAFDDPTLGLTICEGIETGIALLMGDLAPVWCCGAAGNLAALPVLSGIQALTIAADADEPGQKAADAVGMRWREAGREAVIIAPPTGDWADGRR